MFTLHDHRFIIVAAGNTLERRLEELAPEVALPTPPTIVVFALRHDKVPARLEGGVVRVNCRGQLIDDESKKRLQSILGALGADDLEASHRQVRALLVMNGGRTSIQAAMWSFYYSIDGSWMDAVDWQPDGLALLTDRWSYNSDDEYEHLAR